MAHYQITRWDTDAVIYEGEAETLMDLVNEAVKNKVSLDRASLVGAILVGASLDGAILDGASLVGARLVGARLRKGEILGLRSFSGLYKYHILAYVLKDGATPCVKMGCLDFTLDEWHAKGVANSNLDEFPNDGSYLSMQRIRAFDYARSEVLALKAKLEAEAKP